MSEDEKDQDVLDNRRHVLFNDRDFNALCKTIQIIKRLLSRLFSK